jgi:hypothetical protein
MCHRALLDPRTAHFFRASMKTWLSRPERAAADVAGQRRVQQASSLDISVTPNSAHYRVRRSSAGAMPRLSWTSLQDVSIRALLNANTNPKRNSLLNLDFFDRAVL